VKYSRRQLADRVKWGVSNFSPALLAEYIAEAEKQGVPKPALYQGQYNPVARSMEADLFPLLKEHGIKFYAYRYDRYLLMQSISKLITLQSNGRRLSVLKGCYFQRH
jgi:hypothetical protein